MGRVFRDLQGKDERVRMGFQLDKRGVRLGSKGRGNKVSVVQELLFKSTDYLRRIIAPVGGQGGVTMSYLCPNCTGFPLEDYVCWVSGGKHTNWWCAIFVERSTIGSN